MKYFYAILCLIGILFPYYFFIPWLLEHGINIELFISDITQSQIGAFAWSDVIVSAIVLVGFIIIEGKRQNMRRLWIPLLGTFTVGVSLGLPLFLLMREIHLTKIVNS